MACDTITGSMADVSTAMAENRIMEESVAVIQQHSNMMKQAMDTGNIREVLKHSSALIAELRTSALSAKKYYELYLHVLGELHFLHTYFSDRTRHRRPLAELYESVQHAGNVLPRLYLLVTVGAACIKQKEMPARDALMDLTELCKGVQQPVRGLFLRYFLVQICKDVLPDTGDEDYPDYDPNVKSDIKTNADVSFEFLYNNCIEAAKLWIRVQFQIPSKQRAKKETERHSLRVLVGTNLVRMAQLDCMTYQFYKNVAFPKIIHYIVHTRDIMSQQYLLECIVQAFSDECHLSTLSLLMDGVCSVNSTVDVTVIASALIGRLKKFLMVASSQVTDKAVDSEITQNESALINSTKVPSCANSIDLPSNCSDKLLDKPQLEIQDSNKQELVENIENGMLQSPYDNIYDERHIESNQLYQDNTSSVLLNISQEHITSNKLMDHDVITERVAEKKIHEERQLKAFTDLKQGIYKLVKKAENEHYGTTPLQPSVSTNQGKNHPPLFSRLTLHSLFNLLIDFLEFTVSLFPGRTDLIDSTCYIFEPIILAAQEQFTNLKMNADVNSHQQQVSQNDSTMSLQTGNQSSQLIADLLSLPMGHIGHLPLLYSQEYPCLLNKLTDQNKLHVFRSIAKALVSTNQFITDLSSVKLLYELSYSPMLHDDKTFFGVDDPSVWKEHQCYAAKLIHLIKAQDSDLEFTMLITAKECLMQYPSHTYKHTLPSVVFKSLQLFFRIQGQELARLKKITPQHSDTTDDNDDNTITSEDPVGNIIHTSNDTIIPEEISLPEKISHFSLPTVNSKRVLQLIHGICTEMMDWDAELAFRLTLQAAEGIAVAEMRQSGTYSSILCEFLRQCIVCYEELLTENKSKVKALGLLVGLVAAYSSCVDTETMDSLAEKLTRHAAKLLRKSEQCIGILQCSHLFWSSYDASRTNIARVQECLQRSLKIVLGSLQYSLADIPLLMDVLEKYIFYFEKVPQEVPAQAISSLLSLCSEQLAYGLVPGTHSTGATNDSLNEAKSHLNNIINYIKACKKTQNSGYNAIDLSSLQL